MKRNSSAKIFKKTYVFGSFFRSMQREKVVLGLILVFFGVCSALLSRRLDATVYSQIVIPFFSKKDFTYDWIESSNSLIFKFPKVNPQELSPIENYDERLIRRVLVKDLGANGTELHLVLKNRDVKALVETFQDPFRISIDLFDQGFKQQRDPITGLPIDASDREDLTAKTSSSSLEGLTSTSSALGDSQQVNPKTGQVGSDVEKSKRKLLQPLPDAITTDQELKGKIASIPAESGPKWSSFPPYIYRAQLAPFEGKESTTKTTRRLQNDALKEAEGMADYAGHLYDLGHEQRALFAYQQVLIKDPSAIESDPLHIWKLAESHLGVGNSIVADGYYAALLERFPNHPLAARASIRRLDIKAIYALENGTFRSESAGLVDALGPIEAQTNAEVQAMAKIRKAWWSDASAKHDSNALIPAANDEISQSLKLLVPEVESKKTGFIASAMIAKHLTNPNSVWTKDTAPWLNSFFATYLGASTEPTRSELLESSKSRLRKEIEDRFLGARYIELVNFFDSLPEPMKSIRKDPQAAWYLAESARSVGKSESALGFYENAAKSEDRVESFKASFWAGAVAGGFAGQRNQKSPGQEVPKGRQDFALKSQSFDANAWKIWQQLSSDDKALLSTSMMPIFEEDAASGNKTSTSARILLERWSTELTKNPPKILASNGNNPTETVNASNPAKSTVRLLNDLGKKFAVLNMQRERRQSLELMRFLKPADFEGDKEASKVWSDQMLKLAEERRQANEFLEAGELYTMIGQNSTESENRAEANYKGGLLLLRAGRKQDAVQAFERAKSDPNNLFYSKLASERLQQMDAH
jgi:hypothetical protein